MKKLAKFSTLLLILATLCTSILPLFVSAEEEISPYYLNTNSCYFSFVAANGTARPVVSYKGVSGSFSYANVTVKIQKRFLGVFWTKVDEWTETCYDVNGLVSNTTPLEKTGTYRAVFTVKIYGKDGSVDTIEDTITSTYD